MADVKPYGTVVDADDEVFYVECPDGKRIEVSVGVSAEDEESLEDTAAYCDSIDRLDGVKVELERGEDGEYQLRYELQGEVKEVDGVYDRDNFENAPVAKDGSIDYSKCGMCLFGKGGKKYLVRMTANQETISEFFVNSKYVGATFSSCDNISDHGEE